MSINNNFAIYYDKIFPRNPKIVSFLDRTFKSGKILDLACGTGEYALALAHIGYQVSAIDLSESMISHAQSKAQKEHVQVNFKVENMLNLSDINAYNGIICIGNSLLHLDTETEIEQALFKMFQSLQKQGKLVLQVINYDLILDKKLPGLTTVSQEEFTFYRNYEFDGTKIHFKTRLTDGLRVFVDDTLLTPLKYEDLTRLLKQVGFKTIQTVGGFSHDSFDIHHDITYVVTAKK